MVIISPLIIARISHYIGTPCTLHLSKPSLRLVRASIASYIILNAKIQQFYSTRTTEVIMCPPHGHSFISQYHHTSLGQEISEQTNDRPTSFDDSLFIGEIEFDGTFDTHELIVVQVAFSDSFQVSAIYDCRCNEQRGMMTTEQECLDINQQH